MQFTQEFNVETFQFWGPAKAVVDEIRRARKMDGLQELIETAFYEDTPSKTAINDFVWTESDFILKQLGLREDPEEEEEEEEEEDDEEEG